MKKQVLTTSKFFVIFFHVCPGNTPFCSFLTHTHEFLPDFLHVCRQAPLQSANIFHNMNMNTQNLADIGKYC